MKWVALIVWRTCTDRVVPDHMTASIDTTTTWAWVLALLIQARLVLSTVGAENAFRTTMWGSAKVTRKARTDAISVCHLLRAERPTKVSRTRIGLLIFKQLFFGCHWIVVRMDIVTILRSQM